MIVDKKTKKVISGNTSTSSTSEQETVDVPVQIPSNGVIDVLNAMCEILKKVTWEYGVSDSPLIFKTVQIDDGQYERIVSETNTEETLGFPAAFVHFINWHYLTSAKRFNEGRAELRIRFIMNRLNTHDHDENGSDVEVYYVANRIHQTIQENISNYTCLQERCQLMYVDPMESFHDGLQPCWMTYEIWFKETNIWVTRKRVVKYIVFPPFTNHSDQDSTIEDINPDNHTNADHPITHDEVTGYVDYIPSEESESEG